MIIYIVKANDTIYEIAKAFQISPDWIVAANDLNEPDELVIGQPLVIPLYKSVYSVKTGDSLFRIAQEENITIRRLWQLNPQLRGDDILYPDETLILSQKDEPTQTIEINGYAYPFLSKEILKQTLPYLTYLTIFTYGFEENGNLIIPNDEEIVKTAKSYGVLPILLLSTLNEDGFFDNNLSSILLNDPILQDRIIENLIVIMKEKGYGAIDVDFEYIYPKDGPLYVEFIRKLRSRMMQAGFGTIVSLAPKISDQQEGLLYEGHLYGPLGEVADRLTIMAYEWGYTYGPVKELSQLYRIIFPDICFSIE